MAKRRIVVEGQEYQYVVGHSFVRITDPTGHSRAIPFDELTGMSWATIENGRRKHWFSIRPREVAAFIANGYRRSEETKPSIAPQPGARVPDFDFD